MGCFRTIGCAVVLVVCLAAAWFFRDDLLRLLDREDGRGAEAVVRTESSRWRGTGGMVRDLVVAPQPVRSSPAVVVVIEGGAVPAGAIGSVVREVLRPAAEPGERPVDAAVAVTSALSPAGFIALRASALSFASLTQSVSFALRKESSVESRSW